MPRRRIGDTIPIAGDYQFQALHRGPAPQRFWHETKHWLVDMYLNPRPGDRVLDVGCGSGVVAAHLADRPVAECVAVDGNPEAIAFARATFPRPNLRFVRTLVDELDLPGDYFDSACCMELIEHLYPEQGEELLRTMRRLVRPGGRLLLTTPNARSLWPVLEWLLDRSRKVPKLLGDQHVAFYARRRLERLAAATGWVTVCHQSCCTIAPWSAWLSERLARSIRRLERNLPCGTILVHVLERPAQGGTGS
jgi:2-polyprenyl-3-methyl-5-hydroxy-6-metoxy-1,4-benzoquinol methylase